MKKLWPAFIAVALVVCATIMSPAQTQITTGVIQGTVMDVQSAVIPAAEVELRNLDTNFARKLTTDADGRFVAVLLPPGRYSVTVSKAGFAKTVFESVALSVGQAVVLPVTMRVAGREEQITVASTPVVETVKTESSSTLNETAVSNTPILGRKFEDMLTLTPGVSVVQGPDGDEINFNGQRGIFNNISLDGGDFNNGFFGEQMGGQRAAVDITLEAVKEFQVVAAGASAEFGRTAGGVVNVITKSGTNDLHGSLFHYQRLETLSANTSDDKPLKDFHREQFGGTIGGPIVKDKQFFFAAVEQIAGNLERPNLSEPIGTPCPVPAPTILSPADEVLINSNFDCQRLALINFMRTSRNQEEGLPVRRPLHNTAVLGKWDWTVNPSHQASISYNFDYSKKINETFDVATYGNSANGIEGPSKIQNVNFNLISTLTPRLLSEAHFTFSREDRPRSAVQSNVPADTAMGGFFSLSEPTFRFGAPFFLQPNIDELFWRTQVRDNVSLVSGKHNMKFGGEWMHSLNDQIFRGFFTGRYIFDSVVGFLRYASPDTVGGFGPDAGRCPSGVWVDIGTTNCPGPGPSQPGTTPLLLYLQGAGREGPATDAAGASRIDNEDFAAFAQDKWQIWPNLTLTYGLRWEAQLFPEPTAPPSQTAYGSLLNDSRFPSDGTLPDQTVMFQPRVGIAWDLENSGKSVLRASFGIYNARQNMLTQVGSITTNGLQQQTIAGGLFANPTIRPTWPDVVAPTPVAPGQFPLFTGVRVFDREYRNPRVYTTNVAYEREIMPDVAAYVDFTWNKGVYLTNFLDHNRADRGAPFAPALGEVMVTSSRANSLYRGITFGARKRFSNRYQLEANYTYAQDWDNDSNERDPFTDRSGPATPAEPFNLRQDYAPSARDIRHKFNLVMFAELPGRLEFNPRIQARSAQPMTPTTGGPRNSVRKDNEFFSFDWRLQRPFKIGDRYSVVPVVEMFNTFNNKNNINPLVTPGLFNFDGFLRHGVGDPRQMQLAVKLAF